MGVGNAHVVKDKNSLQRLKHTNTHINIGGLKLTFYGTWLARPMSMKFMKQQYSTSPV